MIESGIDDHTVMAISGHSSTRRVWGIGLSLVDRKGFEPSTSALRTAPRRRVNLLTHNEKHLRSHRIVTITTARVNTHLSA